MPLKSVSCYITEPTYQRLQELAKKQNRSISFIVRDAVLDTIMDKATAAEGKTVIAAAKRVGIIPKKAAAGATGAAKPPQLRQQQPPKAKPKAAKKKG